MKTALLLLAFWLSLPAVKSQMIRNPVGAVYPRLTTYSKQFSDAFSFGGNQAALATVNRFSAGVFSERRFMLQELSTYSLAVALPTHPGNFGLKGDYAGSALYNETALGLAYARSLGSQLDVGVQFNYTALKAASYGTASVINFDAGAIFHLTGQLQTGVHIYNPVKTKWGKEGDEKLPFVFSAGLGYDVSPVLFLGAEAEKMEDQPLSINAGLHYQVAGSLVARAGISTATSVYYLGLGFQLRNFRLDATATIHPYLGTTPGLLLIYSPKE